MTNKNSYPENSNGGGYEVKLIRQMSTEQLCNRNELINADFRQGRLVNQRNITDKTGNGYTVDMWYISTGNPNQCGVRVEEDGIVLYKHQDNVFFDFATLIEDGSKFSNQKCTISVLAKCSTLGMLISMVHQGTENVILNKVITGDSTKFEIYVYTFQVPALAFGDYLKIAFRHRQSTSKSEQPKIQKAMLEYGDISTLHNWHGDYAETLAKCQRYYYPLKSYYCYGYFNGKYGEVFLPLPTEMRIKPTINVSATGVVYHNTGALAVESVDVHYLLPTGAQLLLGLANNATYIGNVVYLEGMFELSAEL